MKELDALSQSKYLSITTVRKSGEKVATPVWVTSDGDALFVITGATSGKVKRIRNNPNVELAPCDARGRISGRSVSGVVELLDAQGTEHVRKLVAKRYGLMYKAMQLVERVRRNAGDSVGLRITLAE